MVFTYTCIYETYWRQNILYDNFYDCLNLCMVHCKIYKRHLINHVYFKNLKNLKKQDEYSSYQKCNSQIVVLVLRYLTLYSLLIYNRLCFCCSARQIDVSNLKSEKANTRFIYHTSKELLHFDSLF